VYGLSVGFGFRIGFSADLDVRGNFSALCDCRYGLLAGHMYRDDLQQILFAGLVYNWPVL
jgi:hypothetical protein